MFSMSPSALSLDECSISTRSSLTDTLTPFWSCIFGMLRLTHMRSGSISDSRWWISIFIAAISDWTDALHCAPIGVKIGASQSRAWYWSRMAWSASIFVGITS